jgi:hypothetical protein
MVREEIVTIPHGISIKSEWIQEVKVREITGRDELSFSELSSLPVSAKTVAIVKRLVAIGLGKSDIKIENLTLGDINTLILYIRRLNYGNILECAFSCDKCEEDLSFVMDVNSLIPPASFSAQRLCKLQVKDLVFEIRPVTFSDVFSLNTLEPMKKKSDYVLKLIQKCIIKSNVPISKETSRKVINKISDKLEELDPFANIIFKNKCPSCLQPFTIYFSPGEFLLKEIENSLRSFDLEVHLLAFFYHWSLNEIYSIPAKKRKEYVELIVKTWKG